MRPQGPRLRRGEDRQNAAATGAGSIYNRPYEPTLDLLRHLDRARAVGLLGVARRAGPEARQALDAGAGPALGVRAAAVRELLALVAGADGPNEAQRRNQEEGRGLDHVGVVVRVVVAVCGGGGRVSFYGRGAGRGEKL